MLLIADSLESGSERVNPSAVLRPDGSNEVHRPKGLQIINTLF